MRILIILIILIGTAACELDVDEKCPEFRKPIEDFNISDLLGKQWFVLQMVVHYQGRTPIKEYVEDNCADDCNFYLNISGVEREKTSADNKTKYTTIYQVLICWNSSITNQSLIKLDISEDSGIWTGNETTVQVMLTNSNITILTFCDSDRLFSLILKEGDNPYTESNYNLADKNVEIFRDYSLRIEGVKKFSAAHRIKLSTVLFWLCAFKIACVMVRKQQVTY